MKEGRQKEVFLLAEGLINGKVVATHKVCPARRPSKLLLWIDNENTELKADGSDFVTVIAAIADKNGNIKRLNNYYVKFHIEGEGRILGGANVLANPASRKMGNSTDIGTIYSETRQDKDNSQCIIRRFANAGQRRIGTGKQTLGISFDLCK